MQTCPIHPAPGFGCKPGCFGGRNSTPAQALHRVGIKQFVRSVPQVCSSFLRTSTGLRTEDPEAADAALDGCRRRPSGHRNPCRGVAGTGGRWVGFGCPQPVIQRTSSLPCPHIRRPSIPGRIVSGPCGLREQMPNFLAGCGNNPCGARQDLLRAEMVIFSGEAACTWLKRAETICDGMRRS